MKKLLYVMSCTLLLGTALLFLSGCAHEEEPQPSSLGAESQPADETQRDYTPQDTHPRPNPGYRVSDFFDEDIAAILNSDLSPRDQLLALGWEDSWMYGMDEALMQNMLTQMRFSPFLEALHNGLPIGESGLVVAPQYRAGMYFNDDGTLIVLVLPGAFNDPHSRTAIEEMQSFGIIINEAIFTDREMDEVTNQLNHMHDRVTAAGSTSWGRTATHITMWVDPYTPQQLEILRAFLQDFGFDLAMFQFEPQITDQMREHRINLINEAVNASRENIFTSDVIVSRTGIAFTKHNRTTYEFTYGAPFDLARYENGQWVGVPFLQGRGGGMWNMQAYMLQSGGIDRHARQSFEWLFGELEPGRYLLIRDGWLGNWQPDHDRVFAIVEFEITETTPRHLPEVEPQTFINPIVLVNPPIATPTSITLTIENQSPYNIDHRAQILSVVRDEDILSDNFWDWWDIALPSRPEDNAHFFDHGLSFLPAGQQLTFTIDWYQLFGTLEPGAYRIVINTGGHAHPPHPHGWLFADPLIIPFTID